MTAEPIAAAGRRHRRVQRLGPDAACVRCGLTEPTALLLVPRHRVLEAHHVCGRANDATLTVPVCRNCHALLTDAQHAAGVTFTQPESLLHQIAAALRSLFTMLAALCDHGLTWADALERLASDLDRVYPAWRDLPNGKPVPGFGPGAVTTGGAA